jgi:flagellar protein FlaJ
MKMDRLNRTIEKIQLKYDLKREYFTVLVPVIVALLLIAGALLTGHTFTEAKKETLSGEAAARQKAYEELVKQLEEETGEKAEGINITVSQNTEEIKETDTTKADMDHFIIYALLIAITPFSIDRYLLRRKKRKHEEDFSQFLFKLSEMMRAGIDPVKSVIELSKTDLGSITPYLNHAAASMILGSSFEEGMKKVSGSLNSELITRYVDLVIQASYTGGSVSDLILKASEDMRAMIMIEREMEGNLKQYTVIFYFAQGILVVMAFILLTTLFPSLLAEGAMSALGGSGFGNIDFNQGFFHLIIINAVIGGVIIGKISEGSAQDGLKHSVILTIACYLVCILVILPAANAGENVTISVISGNNQEVIGGLPLTQPIVFLINDTAGKPKSGVYLDVKVTPSGKYEPSIVRSDREGKVNLKVIPGTEPGLYTVEVKSGDSIGAATIKVV